MKKPMIVKTNGKITNINRVNRDNYQRARTINSEQAATMEDSGHNIETFTKASRPSKNAKRPPQRFIFRDFKPIIIASIAAIIIGSIFGVIMLKMFANFENSMPPVNNSQSTIVDKTNDEDKDGEDNEHAKNALAPMQAHVLQAGVFSEQVNAEALAKSFQAAGIVTLLWERDNQYYLLAGVTSTKEQAKSIANVLQEKDLEVYVKEWYVKANEAEFSAEEIGWFQSFQDEWLRTLKVASEQTSISMQQWLKLIKDIPEKSDTITALVGKIKPIVEQVDEAGSETTPYLLLTIWNEYESAFK